MKKIGILTFHNVPNYGAVLQSYALKNFLEKNSMCEVNIIDFQCQGNDNAFESQEIQRSLINGKELFLKKIIKLIRYITFDKKNYTKKLKEFSEFRSKYLSLDSELGSLSTNYKLLVCGSDQIWNPNITGGFQDYYFGANTNQRDVKTISYAASCGDVAEISSHYEKQFFKIVKNLYKVGVREETLNSYLLENQVNSSCNIDPTFLLSKEEYINNFKLNASTQKCILVYALQKNEILNEVAQVIAKKLNLPIICICGYHSKGIHKKNELFDVAPTTFLELLYNSEYVITNSFHGLAFSLIFEKNFNVIMPKSRGTRIIDLLKKTKLTDRIYQKDNINIKDIDYRNVNNLLKFHIDLSKQYLINEVGEMDNGTV